MARRNDCKSVQHGSDAIFDITCTPCGEDYLQEEAVKYCSECEEYLCTACTKCHQRMKATREHKLTGATQAKQNPVVAKTESTEKCWYHVDRNIEMYCRTHDMVYCARCIATEHRTCSGVIDVGHATKEDYSQCELQRLQTETGEVYEQLVAIRKEKEKALEATEEQETKSLTTIKELERQIVGHIEKLGREATDALKEKYTDVRNELKTCMSKVDKMIGKVEERKKKLEEAVSMVPGEKFVQFKLGEKGKDDAKKLYKESDSELSKVIQFTENKLLSDEIMKLQSLGEIVKVEQQKKLHVRTAEIQADDEFTCSIVDLCQFPDGRIILVDQKNRKLKVLYENYQVKKFWKIKGEPTGICCIGKNEVAVKMRSNTVLFYTVSDSSLDLERSRQLISIKDGRSWGLAYFDGNLWMSYRNGVRVYSITGVLQMDISSVPLHTEDEDDLTPSISLSPIHLSVCRSKRHIFLTDGDQGLVCLDRDGDLKYDVRVDERLSCTRGVCVTRRGTVFISGFKSNNVVMFSKEGECLGEIVTEDMLCQKGPIALLYDFKTNSLLITFSNSDNIIVVD